MPTAQQVVRGVASVDKAAAAAGKRKASSASHATGVSKTFELTEIDHDHEDLSTLLRQYNKESFAGGGFATDILMYLDANKVKALRREFQRNDDGLALHEFVYLMKSFLEISRRNSAAALTDMSESVLVANLTELFDQIDVNGDGTMEWEEFTSFIVDMGMHTSESSNTATIHSYHPRRFIDLSKHFAPIEHLKYWPKLRRFGACELGSNVLKLYSPTCELKTSIRRTDGIFTCCDYIPELSQVVAASTDLQMSFYDDNFYKLHKCFHTPTSQLCMTWCGEARSLYSAGMSGIVYAWDAELMEERFHMGGYGRDGQPMAESHTDAVLDVLAMPHLERVASASMDHTIRLWDMNTGRARSTLFGHSKGIRSLAYSPDYRFLISAGFDYDALVWNPYVEKLILPLHGHTSSLIGVQVVPGTPQILTADTEGIFKLWDIRNFSCIQTFTGDDASDELRSFVTLPEKRRIVSAGKRLHIFDYERQENPELTDDTTVFAAFYNPTSCSFISASGREVKVWSAMNGTVIRRYRPDTGADLTTLVLDDRERKFITGDQGGKVVVFDYLNGVNMKTLHQHESEVTHVIYVSRDKAVISASRDRHIAVSDEVPADKGSLLKDMQGGHSADISALVFSEHLSLIASGSTDASIIIWDYEFARIECMLVGHTAAITALEFLDPWPLLVSADANGSICIWALRGAGPAHVGKCVMRFVNEVDRAVLRANRSRQEDGATTIGTGFACPVLSMKARVFNSEEELSAAMQQAPRRMTSTDASAASAATASANAAALAAAAAVEAAAEHQRSLRGQETKVEDIDVEAATSAEPKESAALQAAAAVVLYTGDDRGRIKCWVLTPLIHLLESHHIRARATPWPVQFPRRNVLSDVSTTLTNYKGTAEYKAYLAARAERSPFYTTKGYPLAGVDDVHLVQDWQAHSDAIYCIELCRHPSGLVSSSFDRYVKVWDKDGKRTATLQQGGPKLPWLFRVDNIAKTKGMMAGAKNILTKLRTDFNSSDFARLQAVLKPASPKPLASPAKTLAMYTRWRTRRKEKSKKRRSRYLTARGSARRGSPRSKASPLSKGGRTPRSKGGHTPRAGRPAKAGGSTRSLKRSPISSPRRPAGGAGAGAGAGAANGSEDMPKAYTAFTKRLPVSTGASQRGKFEEPSTGAASQKPASPIAASAPGKPRVCSRYAGGARKLTKKLSAKAKPPVPPLNLPRRSPSPDMDEDVLKNFDSSEDEEDDGFRVHGAAFNSGRSGNSSRATKFTRATPRLEPITAKNAGRSINATHRGRLLRMSPRPGDGPGSSSSNGGGGSSGGGSSSSRRRGAASSGSLPRVSHTAR